MDFRNWTNWSEFIVPASVESKMRDLNLRVKDIVYTFNQPMRERQYPEDRKYKRVRWFGSYWAGLYCKWDKAKQKWVILTCWREDVLTISYQPSTLTRRETKSVLSSLR
jgi:hypothetical protein